MRALRVIALSLFAAAGALGLLAGSASATTDLYVAPTGSDSAPGTIEKPFRTLQRAQAEVRAATAGMTSDIVVNLRGGTFGSTSPLRLRNGAGDSGENGHSVIYQAYGYGTAAQEVPVVSGGRAITKWRLEDRRRHIWRVEVGRFSTRQLYRNGRPLAQASVDGIPGKVKRTATGYTTTSTAPQSWADPASIEFVYTTVGYAQAICGVARITGTSKETTITMDQPCFRMLTQTYTYNEQDPDTPIELVDPSPVKNSPTFLAAVHSWAIDRSGSGDHHVYYRARAGENPNDASFTAPQKQVLVSGSGSAGAPLHDVAFKGITFSEATWLAPSSANGFVQIFGDYYYASGGSRGPKVEVRFVPGNLRFEHATRLLFEGNRFVHMGADALDVTGSANNVFRGNVFEESAAGALKLDGLNDGSDSQNLIEDNWIHDVGRDYEASIAIYLEDIVDSTLQHNQINDVPYSGIAHTISEATGHGVQILDNRIFNVVEVMMDGGAIYTSGAQGPSYSDGALIAGNHVDRAINPEFRRIDPNGEIGAPNALYTDVGGDFISLERNVVYRSHQSWGGVEPGRMRFTQNYWDDDQLVFYGPTKGLEIADNTLLASRDPRAECERIAACRAIVDNAGLEPAWELILK